MISKCFLGQESVVLLGLVFDADGFRADPQKIQEIVNALIPASTTEIRSFLDLVCYYRRFIQGFSEISSALHAGTSLKVSFYWNAKIQEFFCPSQGKQTTPQVLAFHDFKAPLCVEKDAFVSSIGASLMQMKENGKIYPIYYAIMTLYDAEKKYSTIEQEALAFIFTVK